jgi:hypothetical protein
MKYLKKVCPQCGGKLRFSMDMKSAICEHCETEYYLDPETQHIELDNMEDAGYEFEKGRQRAQKEAEKQVNTKIDIPVKKDNDHSGCLLLVFGSIMVWLAFCTMCGFWK